MSVAELKEEAIRQFAIKVETIDNEAALKVVLDFLEGIGGTNKGNVHLAQHYTRIKEKYSTVLKKLAE